MIRSRLLAALTGLSFLGLQSCTQVPVTTSRDEAPAAWHAHQLSPSPPARFPGPFLCDSMAFFIVHHGGPLAAEFVVNRPNTELPAGPVRVPHAVFWQFYDADERLVKQEYHKFTDEADRRRSFRAELADAKAGIYQLRYAKSQGNKMTVDLRTEPAASFGVMPCRARLGRGKEGQFANTFLYVPPALSSLTLHTYAARIALLEPTGEVVGETSKKDVKLEVTAGRVYGVQVKSGYERSAVGISGVPPILCPDETTARSIRGSVEFAPDGRMLHHKFQVRMWHWMQGLKRRELKVRAKRLLPLKELWLEDPRNAGLVGIDAPFNHIPRILRDQDLDRKSKTYGQGTSTSWLGPAYVIDEPFNPYRRNRAVLNRILLYEFSKLLALKENGTFDANDWNHYSGGDGLGYRKRAFQFGYVAPLTEDRLQELWFEGACRVLNRWAFSRVTCENQSSHWMLDLYMLYLGSGREVYKTLAHDFALAFYDPKLNSFMKTGYQQERYGPDSTYSGLCASNQAIYYEFSRDEVAREGLRKTYDLFNHTVAPEPEGRLLGASNFCHRTAGSWVHRQYNAGLHLMSDEVPEAGVWYPEKADVEKVRAQAFERIEKHLGTRWDDAWYKENMRWLDGYAYHPWTSFFHRYRFPFRGLVKGTWPALQAERFDKNFNDEFFFIRRPSYYAAVYTGSTMYSWVKAQRKPVPHCAGWETEGGILKPMTAAAKRAIWWPTQGLSMFWTPSFGNFLLGKNWNVYTAQTLRADRGDGEVSWQDYWGFTREHDADRHALTLKSPMIDLPVTVTRQLAFLETGIRQEVQVTFTGSVNVTRLVEQIPFLKKEGMEILFRNDEKWGPTAGTQSSGVWLGDSQGNGVALTFTSPVRLSEGTPTQHYKQTIGLLEIDLGSQFSEGETPGLSYLIEAMERNKLGGYPHSRP